MVFRVVLATLVVMSWAAAANAAVISSADGAVTVNQGYGFKPVSVGSEVYAGQRVLVRSGSATITFYDDCEITVYAGNTYRVPDDPECRPGGGYFPIAGPGLVFLGAATLIGAGAIVAATTGSDDDVVKPASP